MHSKANFKVYKKPIKTSLNQAFLIGLFFGFSFSNGKTLTAVRSFSGLVDRTCKHYLDMQTVSENCYVIFGVSIMVSTIDATVWVFLYFLEIKCINLAQ
jgi:hypothetical protein